MQTEYIPIQALSLITMQRGRAFSISCRNLDRELHLEIESLCIRNRNEMMILKQSEVSRELAMQESQRFTFLPDEIVDLIYVAR